ncbi:hypothetical protein ASPTUDRAFT_372476 [Aspergillus tubingensis CBS 134.48]|uniref:Uncharacterized protein n=1 Tax=Aspergillus tubingensis (strain CBS 134.48) TaxID=767770 RepID=A0A1L9NIU4_ASPTC|nr:hypothetical protein ASPTUDRAFT_372476 [Aspergillus tubingensis CBS 134.48]
MLHPRISFYTYWTITTPFSSSANKHQVRYHNLKNHSYLPAHAHAAHRYQFHHRCYQTKTVAYLPTCTPSKTPTIDRTLRLPHSSNKSIKYAHEQRKKRVVITPVELIYYK